MKQMQQPFVFQFHFQEQEEGTEGCTAPRGPEKELKNEKTESQGLPTHQPPVPPLAVQREEELSQKQNVHEVFFACFYFSIRVSN